MSGNLKTLDIRILKAVPGYRRAFQVDAALTPLHILDESQPKMSMHLIKSYIKVSQPQHTKLNGYHVVYRIRALLSANSLRVSPSVLGGPQETD